MDRDFGQWLPKDYKNDLEIISQSIDFMGLNIYFGHRVESSADGFKMSQLKEGHAVTGIDWVVSEASLYWGPLLMHERYNHPIMITENGLSNKDWVFLDGKVHDYARIDFLTRYLRQLYHAKEDGAEITGYFHWSLMDNFEWADGYRERFGLVHVDFATGKRTKKDSYYWYRDIVQGKQDF